MRFKPDVNFLGKKATFSSQIVVNNSLIDANLSDNTDTISQIIRGSYDPNDKQVTPRGIAWLRQVCFKNKNGPLSIGSVLTNKAGIYFDYNPPVITNQVRLNVVNKLTNVVQEIVSLAKVYPNPTSDNLIIDLIGNTQTTQIVVSNVLGQVLKTVQFEEKSHRLDVQSLENGVYMLSFRQGERVQNMSFMVQR